MIFSCSSESKLELVKPARLEVGDTIAFCAPSGFLDSSRMFLAKKRLIEKGFHIVYDDSLFRNWGYLAGKDIIRANELMTYFEDCLLYTSPSPRDKRQSRMPSSA